SLIRLEPVIPPALFLCWPLRRRPTRRRTRSPCHWKHPGNRIFHNKYYATFLCRSPIETSPTSTKEMSRSSVCLRFVEVAWDDGDHDEPQRVDASAGGDRCR